MKHILEALRRYWWIVLICGVLGGVLMGLRSQDQGTRWAMARASLVSPMLREPEPQTELLPVEADIESETDVLKSYPVLEQVAFRLRMLQEPELEFSSAQGDYNQPIHLLHKANPLTANPDVKALQSLVKVKKQENAAALQIMVRETSTYDAVAIANAVADEYARLKQLVLRDQIGQMEAKLSEHDQKIKDADTKREAFLKKHPKFVPGIKPVAAPAPALLDQSQVTALDSELVDLNKQKSGFTEMQRRFSVQSDPIVGWLEVRQQLPSVKVDASLKKIQTLERDRLRLLQQYTPEHSLVQENATIIDSVHASLRNTISKAIAGKIWLTKQQIARVQDKKQRLSRSTSVAIQTSDPAVQTEYESIKQEVDEASQLYGTLSGQLAQRRAQLTDVPQLMGIVYASSPRLLHRSYLPILYGVLVGLLCGVLLALLLSWFVEWAVSREKREKTPRAPKTPSASVSASASAEPENPQMQILGRVPRLDFSKTPLELQSLLGQTGSGEEIDMTLRLSPPAALLAGVEAFRNIRTQLLFHESEEKPLLIILVSAQTGEGVSTVAANLAVSMAQAGKRTLLIESDLQDPQLHDAFGLRRIPGITDVLMESSPLKDTIQNASHLLMGELEPEVIASVPGIGNLRFLFAGSPVPNPSEMLSMPAFAELMLSFRETNDVILMDSGSLLSSSAASVLTALGDGVVLVHCPQKRGSKKAVARAMEMLNIANVWGTVLSDVPKEYL